MLRAHKIRLMPTAAQAPALAQTAGYARCAYNWAVDEFRAGLTAGEWLNDYALRPRWNRVKHIRYGWGLALSQNAAKGAIIDAGKAIERWGQYRKELAQGRKPGRRVGFPQIKRRSHGFRADNGAGTVRVDGKAVILPKLGRIRMREELRFDGRICEVRISVRAGKWYAAFQVDDGLAMPIQTDDSGPAIGVDAGIKHLAVCSDGTVYDNPAPLRRLYRTLRRESKALSRKRKGSSNWRKQVVRIERVHARIADVRSDALHKASTAIVRKAGSLSVETLNISGMMRNRRLARAIADSGMAEFLRQLEYKAAQAGKAFRRIDRWYPSSRLCNHCGWRNDTLTLAQRDWWCGGCGAQVDRDLNAARNIRDYERPGAARRQPVEICVRPARPAAVGEAGTATPNGQLRLW